MLLSILVFIVFQFALASALDGESWEGMQILLTAVIIGAKRARLSKA